MSLIKSLVDRAYKIYNTWYGFNNDIHKLTSVLNKNLYHTYLINNVICNYLNKVKSPPPLDSHNINNNDNDRNRVSYFKLPFIGKFSVLTQRKVKHLVKKYCKDLNIKLVFTSFKLRSLFGVKDPVPKCFRAHVVYKFLCGRCSASYVGETSRHLSTQIREHLVTENNSHIDEHLNESPSCCSLSS